MKHIKNTPTKYEFAFADQSGKTVLTFWMVSKSIPKVIKFSISNLDHLCKETDTKPEHWSYNLENRTVFNDKAGIIGRFTGRTLFEVKGE